VIRRRIDLRETVPPAATPAAAPPPVTDNGAGAATIAVSPNPLEKQVQTGLNLLMPMKSPAQMPGLLSLIKMAQPLIDAQLAALHSVHFARFLPTPDGSGLYVITTFDGELNAYLMDFVAALGDVFNVLLQYIAGAPPLPVQKFPREFCEFVSAHDMKEANLWSAYPHLTVVDILHGQPTL
jgi:hypothetical protein